MNIKLYEVGGSIRDSLLGRKTSDLDYAVEADSFEDMKTFIARSGGQFFLVKPEYQTVRAKLNGKVADFVLCRKDGVYSDGRRPDNVVVGNIYDDLSRRDFTMNAIAKDENGKLIDPYNGIADIKSKVIACVGNSCDRVREDSLRLLRAMRFSITLDFAIEESLHDLFFDNTFINLLDNVSVERTFEELTKCFAYNTFETLEFLKVRPQLSFKLLHNSKIRLLPTLREV